MKKINLEQFVEAQNFFNDLREKAIREGGERDKVPVTPDDSDLHFRTAAYAAALLYQRGVERLQELEKEKVVHPSTIAGASLGSAVLSLKDYIVQGKSAFERDEYEQLARTCYSAKRLLELKRERR